MIGYWAYRYTLNEDTSLVEYHHVTSIGGKAYPAITMCFKNPFLQEQLTKKGLNESSYLDYALGKSFTGTMRDVDFGEITFDLRDYIDKTYLKFRNGTTRFSPLAEKENKNMVSFA